MTNNNVQSSISKSTTSRPAATKAATTPNGGLEKATGKCRANLVAGLEGVRDALQISKEATEPEEPGLVQGIVNGLMDSLFDTSRNKKAFEALDQRATQIARDYAQNDVTSQYGTCVREAYEANGHDHETAHQANIEAFSEGERLAKSYR